MQESLQRAVDARLAAFERDNVMERIWARDHTVWKPDPTEISNRLGWLDVADEMRGLVPELEAFAREATSDGFRHALLLGMGGSSLAPEVIRDAFGIARGMPELLVLDSTDPRQIRETEAQLDPAATLVVVASK